MVSPCDRPSIAPQKKERRRILELVMNSKPMINFVDQVSRQMSGPSAPITLVVVGQNFIEAQSLCEFIATDPLKIVYRTAKEYVFNDDPRYGTHRVIWGERALTSEFMADLVRHTDEEWKTILLVRSFDALQEIVTEPLKHFLSSPIGWPKWSTRNADRQAIITNLSENLGMPKGMTRPIIDSSARMFLETAGSILGSDQVDSLIRRGHEEAVKKFAKEKHPEPYKVTAELFLGEAIRLHSSTRAPTSVTTSATLQ